MSQGGNPPRGWYADPTAPSQERWWDGAGWTDAVRPGPPSYPPPPPPSPAPPPGFGATLPPPPPQGVPVGYGMTQVAGPPPNNYLVYAILTTLFCCLPLGIAAIVKSSQVERRWIGGDQEGSRRASEAAKNLSIVSAVVGVLVLILLFAVGANVEDDSLR